MHQHTNIIHIIGNTPLVRINRVCTPDCAEIWCKMEGQNPGGSVKDRIAMSMIQKAENDKLLAPGGTIIEPTSGNTGIGLAMVAAIKGYRLILTMPESMTMERRQIFEAYGAQLVLSPEDKGMSGAVAAAEQLVAANPGYFMPQQFKNPANPQVHRDTTGREILDALGRSPDAFVAGVGTGGTITGVGEALRERNKYIHIVAVEPADSAVLSGGTAGPHKIAGIGAGFLPDVLNTKIYDQVVAVTNEDAAATTRELALKEGIFCGISSGAALWAAIKTAEKIGKNKKVVVILPDRGDRYLSTGLYAP